MNKYMYIHVYIYIHVDIYVNACVKAKILEFDNDEFRKDSIDFLLSFIQSFPSL